MSDVAEMQMPRYQCHKKVWALKIRKVDFDDSEIVGSGIITPDEPGYLPFKVSLEYMNQHRPQAGGYYVVYEDGYKSFSPAKAFEEGYTRI
jgi:hypothetical protein